MKLALITAGYRRIGAAIAAQLAAAGWTLALHSRVSVQMDQSLAAVLARHGTQWHGFEADLADPAQVAGLLPSVVAHFGCAPSLIVNNASLFIWDDPKNVTAETLSRHMDINLSAPVILASALAARLKADDRACVVNILDQRIRQPNQDQLSYTLSKQALAGATETLARALAPNVRVNAVAPGLTLPTADYLPAQMTRLTAMMPLACLPEPEDIADAVLWLASARATTGQTIFVDGGASLKSFARDFVFLGRGEGPR
jgi:pteridine reductase